MVGIKLKRLEGKYKIIVMAVLLSGTCFLTYHFHAVLGTGTVFTHFFYIPIILASLWWKRKGLLVAIFLSVVLIVSHIFLRPDVLTINDFYRALMFIGVSLVTVMLSEQIAKAEEKTRLAYAELQQIFNTTGGEMRVIDKDFNILRVNDAFCTLAGISKDEAVGKKCYEVFPGSICHTPDCTLTRILSGEKHVECEIEKERKDNTRMHCILVATAFRRDSGELAGIVEGFTDITKRKGAEEELREYQQHLEELVEQRTAELKKAIEQLQGEITERKRAEQQLEIQRARLKSIFDYSLEGIVTLDMDNNILDANLGFENIYGYKLEEVKAKRLDDLIVPERFYYTEAKELDQMALDGILGYETIRKRKDGTELNVSISAGPVKIGGEPRGRFVIFRDITERKQAEEALRESEERLRAIFEGAQDAIFTKDREGHYTQVNNACASLFGLTADEMRGKTDFDVFPPEVALHIKEEVDRKVLERGEVVFVEDTKPTLGGMQTFDVVKVPLRNTNGEIMGLCGIARDITERKQAEEALRKSEEKYRSLIEGLNEAIYRMSLPDGTYEYLSPATKGVFGYTDQEFIDNPLLIRKIMHLDFADYFEEKWADLINGKVPPTYEYKIIDSERSERWIVQSNKGIFDSKGNIIAIEGICRDITELKRAEEALKESEEKLRLTLNR